jgi:hypothetical protein
MKSATVSLTLAVAFACGGATAVAGTFADNASVELFGGANMSMPGSMRAADAPTSNPSGIAYDHLDFDRIYGRGYTAGAEFDYAVNPRLSAFARGAYANFDGRDRRLGTAPGITGTSPVNGRFDDASTRTLDLGARYMFAPDAKLRPFIGVGVGGAELSPVRATIQAPGRDATKVELARGDRVFEQRIETGVQFSPMRNFDLRLTAAAMHFDGQRPSNDPNLESLGLASVHGDVPAHWDYPAELGAVWKF